MKCRHCHVHPVKRPRGLCQRCYYRIVIRPRRYQRIHAAQEPPAQPPPAQPPPAQPPTCRHCRRKKSNRPLGLCWSCYYQAGVRERYRSTSPFHRRGVGEVGTGEPGQPTSARPGTPEKIAVLHQRACLGQELFHPQDAGCDGWIGGLRKLKAKVSPYVPSA